MIDSRDYYIYRLCLNSDSDFCGKVNSGNGNGIEDFVNRSRKHFIISFNIRYAKRIWVFNRLKTQFFWLKTQIIILHYEGMR